MSGDGINIYKIISKKESGGLKQRAATETTTKTAGKNNGGK